MSAQLPWGRLGGTVALAALLTLATLPLLPSIDRWQARRQARARVDAGLALIDADGGAACAASAGRPGAGTGAGTLASWQTIGGCGAGASSGAGGAVKWIGRNVRGGLFRVECQANYIDMPDGYHFVGTSLVGFDLSEKWSLGVSVPYVYKYMIDPYALGIDLANKGPGDVMVLLTRRLGDTNAWSATLAAGFPTGTNDVAFRTEPLRQDRQLGLGKAPFSLVVDHTVDNLWGPVVLGGTANWRGGTNQFGNHRAPSGSLYAYASYLLGPFAPAAGLSVTGYLGKDRDRGSEQALPAASVAANFSLEWSTDWMALLLGTSIPYDLAVGSETTPSHHRLGFWTVSLGAAFAMF